MRQSNCCGANVTEDESNDGFGRCTACKEHCEVVDERLDEPTAYAEALHWQAVNETTRQVCNGVTKIMNFLFDKPEGLNIIPRGGKL